MNSRDLTIYYKDFYVNDLKAEIQQHISIKSNEKYLINVQMKEYY